MSYPCTRTRCSELLLGGSVLRHTPTGGVLGYQAHKLVKSAPSVEQLIVAGDLAPASPFFKSCTHQGVS